MSNGVRWALAAGVAAIVVISPIVCFRATYNHSKRLRVIVPGRVYRSGQLTAAGFADAVKRYGIRTILNLQDDFPDPNLRKHFWTSRTVKESTVCRKLGVRFLTIAPDLIPRAWVPEQRPRAIDEFLEVMDNPENYPILIHCKAGLHRTGILAAVYRMEYQGWTREDAFRELRDHGFGWWKCKSSNDSVQQYVLTYQPGLRIADCGLRIAEASTVPVGGTQ
jgi:tyrosine-protein phosphatase SIW14